MYSKPDPYDKGEILKPLASQPSTVKDVHLAQFLHLMVGNFLDAGWIGDKAYWCYILHKVVRV